MLWSPREGLGLVEMALHFEKVAVSSLLSPSAAWDIGSRFEGFGETLRGVSPAP